MVVLQGAQQTRKPSCQILRRFLSTAMLLSYGQSPLSQSRKKPQSTLSLGLSLSCAYSKLYGRYPVR